MNSPRRCLASSSSSDISWASGVLCEVLLVHCPIWRATASSMLSYSAASSINTCRHSGMSAAKVPTQAPSCTHVALWLLISESGGLLPSPLPTHWNKSSGACLLDQRTRHTGGRRGGGAISEGQRPSWSCLLAVSIPKISYLFIDTQVHLSQMKASAPKSSLRSIDLWMRQGTVARRH